MGKYPQPRKRKRKQQPLMPQEVVSEGEMKLGSIAPGLPNPPEGLGVVFLILCRIILLSNIIKKNCQRNEMRKDNNIQGSVKKKLFCQIA